jgi:cell division protease FtsH
VFLGRDFSATEAYSEDTAQRIDAEIRRIVTEQHDRARKLLEQHQSELDRVARALLEFETLTGEEVLSLFRGGVIERRTPRIPAPTRADEDAAKKRRRPSLIPPIVGKKEPDPEPA